MQDLQNPQVIIDYSKMNCCICGMVFFIPKHYEIDKRRMGDKFYCAAGHAQVFSKPSPEDIEQQNLNLKKVNAELQKRVKELEIEKTQLLHKIDQANII